MKIPADILRGAGKSYTYCVKCKALVRLDEPTTERITCRICLLAHKHEMYRRIRYGV